MNEIVIDCSDLSSLTNNEKDLAIPVPNNVREILEIVGEPIGTTRSTHNRLGLQIPNTRYVLRIGLFSDGVILLLASLTNPLAVVSILRDAKAIAKVIQSFSILDADSGEKCVTSAVQTAQFSALNNIVEGSEKTEVLKTHGDIAERCKHTACIFHNKTCTIPTYAVSDLLENLKDRNVIKSKESKWSVVI